jgi:Tol biopolymer transport system component
VALTIAAAVVIVAMRADDLVPQAHARFVPLVSGPLNESDPAMSPDGRRLAFVQREPGESTSADVYVRDLADGQITRITTDPASDRMPAWSSDGSRLAFVRITPSSCDIFIRELSTGREVRVAPCGNIHEPRVAWSGTGDALIVSQADASRVTSGWRLARIDIATGITTSLIDPPPGLVGDHSPAVSPDGRALAFIRRQSGGVSDIYVASVDGTNLRRITFDDADLTGVDWTGDGRSIVYSSDRAGGYSLWRVAAAGGTPTLLAGGAARMKHPIADRAGRRIVYENWNYEINIWQVGQGREPAVITRSSELWNLYPQISPDGRQLAYVSTESGGHELWIADRDGAHARQLTRAGGGVKSPRWSPDGRRIVFLARHQSAVDVQYVDLSTGDIVPVTADTVNEVAPAWSHDGERVLYGAPDRDGRWNVWSVNPSAPSPPRLEVANAVAAQAAPDGTAWYFTRADQPGLWRTVSNSGTSVERVLDTVATGDELGWTVSRDGLYFVAVQNDTVRLHRAPLMGGESVEIATLAQFTWPGFSLTPDGEVLYARWDRRDSNLMSIEF